MTNGVPAGDILREMDFEDLGVVRVGDPLDPEVVPIHVRLDNDDSAGGALSQKRVQPVEGRGLWDERIGVPQLTHDGGRGGMTVDGDEGPGFCRAARR